MEGALESGLIAAGALGALHRGDKRNLALEALEAATRAGSSVFDVRVPLGSYLWSCTNVRLRVEYVGPRDDYAGRDIEISGPVDIDWLDGRFVATGPLSDERRHRSQQVLTAAGMENSFLPPGAYLDKLDPKRDLRLWLVADCRMKDDKPRDGASTCDITNAPAGVDILNDGGSLRPRKDRENL